MLYLVYMDTVSARCLYLVHSTNRLDIKGCTSKNFMRIISLRVCFALKFFLIRLRMARCEMEFTVDDNKALAISDLVGGQVVLAKFSITM